MEYIMGIDPGQSGAIAILDLDGKYAEAFPVKNMTEKDVSNTIMDYVVDYCWLERVHSMPKQGVSSSFKFGANYGFYKGVLTAWNVRYELVIPAKWQRFLGCLSGGDKNVTKTKAQQLFPHLKITHATADALLIAEYGRRVHLTP